MTDYKLVPVEITDEMVEASGCYGYFRKSAYDQAQDMWSAMLAAAPVVQGEPVGWQYYQHGEWRNGDESIKGHRKNTEEAGFRVRDVYAAPQPAEQQPFEWPRLDRPAKVGAGRFGQGVSSRLVIEAAQRQYEYDVTPEKEAERIAKFADFRKEVLQPVLAAAGLLEALESAKNLIANHSGEVLPDEYAGDQIEQIDAALSAYRKGCEE